MIKLTNYCLLFILFFLSCNSFHRKYHIVQQRLTNNTAYGWGNIFNGGKIKILDLSDTGFEFQLKVYSSIYSDSFVFPAVLMHFISDSIATSSNSNVQFVIHVPNPQSLTIDQSGQSYLLPWRSNEHIFIKDYEPGDTFLSLRFLDNKLNYRIKRKMNNRINNFVECLKDYKTKIIKDSIFSFTSYSGTKSISDDTEIAIILVRNDTLFTAAILNKLSAEAYSNDPVYGRRGYLDHMFYDWFHEISNSNITYVYYSASSDSVYDAKQIK